MSFAFSKSSISTIFLPALAANNAASLTRFAKSAPEKPGVPLDSSFGLTSFEIGVFFIWTCNICSLPLISGNGTVTCLSNLPGLNNAGSKTSGLFVAAITITPSLPSKPSISTSNWLSVCSLSSFPPPTPAPLCLPTASISSIKIIHGAAFFPCSNISRTLDAPTPTNISTKSEPEIVKNGTFASPAIALASNVFPVPGEPTIRTPRGIWPPKFWNLPGSLRKSTSSETSSFASSTPATSLNVTFTWSSVCNFALLFPNDIAPRPPPPPPCICLMKNIQTPINNKNGNQWINILARNDCFSGALPDILTLLFNNSPTSAELSVSGLKVINDFPDFKVPDISLPAIVTSSTWPVWTCCINSE